MGEVVVCNPRPQEHPSVEIDRDTVLITTNQLGADAKGDGRLDAQYLADVSGHPVLALNRIGSGDGVDYSKRLAKRITETPELITEQWYDTLRPALRRQAPSKVQLVGRSAGAGLMLHVEALGLIPETTGILAIEALRLQRIHTRLGQLKYVHYQLRKEGKFKALIDTLIDPDLQPSTDVRPPKAADPKLMRRRQLVDIRHNQHLWASDLPLQNALKIAERDEVAASFVFAEESLAADPERMDEFLEKIRRARALPASNPLVVEIAPRTTHGSFDDQRLYATYYRRFARLLLDPTSE
jgi:hypothetical protein